MLEELVLLQAPLLLVLMGGSEQCPQLLVHLFIMPVADLVVYKQELFRLEVWAAAARVFRPAMETRVPLIRGAVLVVGKELQLVVAQVAQVSSSSDTPRITNKLNLQPALQRLRLLAAM